MAKTVKHDARKGQGAGAHGGSTRKPVGGIVASTRPDTKNAQYQATLKQGDLLLNRVQKLSRVINI